MKKRLQHYAPVFLFLSAGVFGILPALIHRIIRQLFGLKIDLFYVSGIFAGEPFGSSKSQAFNNFAFAAYLFNLFSSDLPTFSRILIWPKIWVVPSGLPHQELFLMAKKHRLGGPEMS